MILSHEKPATFQIHCLIKGELSKNLKSQTEYTLLSITKNIIPKDSYSLNQYTK